MTEQIVTDDSWDGWPLGNPMGCVEEKPKTEKPSPPPSPETGQIGQTSSIPVTTDRPLIKPSGQFGQ